MKTTKDETMQLLVNDYLVWKGRASDAEVKGRESMWDLDACKRRVDMIARSIADKVAESFYKGATMKTTKEKFSLLCGDDEICTTGRAEITAPIAVKFDSRKLDDDEQEAAWAQITRAVSCHDEARDAIRDSIACLSRLPDVPGAWKTTVEQQLRAVLAKMEGQSCQPSGK